MPCKQGSWTARPVYSLQIVQGIEPSKINCDSGALNMTLIEKTITQIKKDLEAGDVTAIEILLTVVSERDLQAFLPED